MMRFLVDNSLSPRLAATLSDAGHDALHVRDLDLARADDEVILDAAADQDRILIVQDTDFGTILAMRNDALPSIAMFRCRAKSTEAVYALLTANLGAIQEDLLAGAVVVFEDARIRVRQLPIFGKP